MSPETPDERMNCEALLFDMDGTLVDSTALVERLWSELAFRWNLVPGEVISHAHGRPTAATLMHFLPAEAVAEELGRFQRDELDGVGIRAIAGAVDFLHAARGLPTALVTSASRRLATHRMEVARIGMPSVVVTADDVQHGKPSPDPFLLAADALGVQPADCLVFEDSDTGLTAAAAAGMRSIVVGANRSLIAQQSVVIPEFSGLGIRSLSDGSFAVVTGG